MTLDTTDPAWVERMARGYATIQGVVRERHQRPSPVRVVACESADGPAVAVVAEWLTGGPGKGELAAALARGRAEHPGKWIAAEHGGAWWVPAGSFPLRYVRVSPEPETGADPALPPPPPPPVKKKAVKARKPVSDTIADGPGDASELGGLFVKPTE